MDETSIEREALVAEALEAERRAFEAEQIRHVTEYSKGRHHPHLDRTGAGYQNPLVHYAWQGWKARAALALLAQQPEAVGWQPIETAPKDGTTVQLLDGQAVWVAYWIEEEDGDGPWWQGASFKLDPRIPTHWHPLAKPLPQPPKDPEA
jgi:hypothetical protein